MVPQRLANDSRAASSGKDFMCTLMSGNGLSGFMKADYTKRCAPRQHRTVSERCFTLGVSEDKLIRLDNLRRVVAERGYSIADLSEKVGGRDTYWRDMLGGSKSFGEKAARKIEEHLNLPRMWLDHSNVPVPPEVADGTTPAQMDLLGLVAQLLHDIAETPEHLRAQAVASAISAVSTARYGTTAEEPPPETNGADDSAPTTAHRKAARKAPTGGRGAKPRRTAR